jgi:hypothetical protein
MKSTLPLFENSESREIAKRHCRSIGISIKTLEALIEAEVDQLGKQRKRGLWHTFDDLLLEEDE